MNYKQIESILIIFLSGLFVLGQPKTIIGMETINQHPMKVTSNFTNPDFTGKWEMKVLNLSDENGLLPKAIITLKQSKKTLTGKINGFLNGTVKSGKVNKNKIILEIEVSDINGFPATIKLDGTFKKNKIEGAITGVEPLPALIFDAVKQK